MTERRLLDDFRVSDNALLLRSGQPPKMLRIFTGLLPNARYISRATTLR
ncbi:unnamed protein product, partial [Ectocarpus sp. 12 AP-2014]